MKITLEFDSLIEHDSYMQAMAAKTVSIHGEPAEKLVVIDNSVTVPHITRRKAWSDSELQFLRDNYQTKKIPWIAKALLRKPMAVYQMLNTMYKQGLPHKNKKRVK